MPKIGMRHIVAAPITAEAANSVPTYGQGKILGPATRGNVTWQRADGKLYGEDVLQFGENGITGGDLAIGTTQLLEDTEAMILGYRYDSTADKYITTGVSAPYVGCGYIQVLKRKTAAGLIQRLYRARLFYKVQFGEEGEETKTKENNIEFGTPEIKGNLFGIYDGVDEEAAFRETKVFSSLSAAVAWLDNVLHVSEPAAITVASAAGSTSGKTALTLSGYTPATGESYLYKTDAATAPAAVYGTTPDYTWTAWNGSDQITATTGHKITVVSVDGDGLIVAAGSATVTSKA